MSRVVFLSTEGEERIEAIFSSLREPVVSASLAENGIRIAGQEDLPSVSTNLRVDRGGDADRQLPPSIFLATSSQERAS